MKYLLSPKKLLLFWYPESLVFFLRTWKNSIFYLEEDLAVSLMFKLLFVPLFHDATLTGRILSFCFRSFRIFLGLFAFLLVTVLVLSVAVVWFLLPFLAFYLTEDLGLIAKGILFSGFILFIEHIISHPPQKIWQIKSAESIWQASFVKKKNCSAAKLIQSYKVKNYFNYLELNPDSLTELKVLESTWDNNEVCEKVWEIGKKLQIPYLKAEHFLAAFLLTIPGIDDKLLKLGLKTQDLTDALKYLQLKEQLWRMVLVFDEDFKVHHLKGINRGWLGMPTPNLDAVSEDLTKKALRADTPDFTGRSETVAQVINILSTEKGRNVLIVGQPGSGKTTLIEYLAKWIISGDAPDALATKRLMRLDLAKLLAGISNQGDLATRIEEIFNEVKNHGNIIVFVDEIQNLGIGEVATSFNLYSLLLPFIESSDFQFIATTEIENYSHILEKNGAFARLFAKVEVTPATLEDTLQILELRAIDTEKNQKICYSFLALQTIAKLSEQYIHDRVLPDSALRVFNECLVKAENNWVKKQTVEDLVRKQTNIPIGEIEKETKDQLLNLEAIIHQKFIDQEEAVKAIAKALRRSAANLKEKNRPIGSFLFVGPTGVGKTELAKILVNLYFLGKGKFIRFDMSEYQTTQALDKLIGINNEGGHLTEEIRYHPYSLILLDEFEKADPKVLNLFLQIIDDGRVTDGAGRTIDFTNTIIIATSNAASLTIAQGLKKGLKIEDLEKMVREELLKIFQPELINRFDGVILFKPLEFNDLQKIVQLKLASLHKQLQEQGYLVEFSEDLIQELTKRGFDKVLGARPLRRLIQDTIEARLAVLILENKLPKGEIFKAGKELLIN